MSRPRAKLFQPADPPRERAKLRVPPEPRIQRLLDARPPPSTVPPRGLDCDYPAAPEPTEPAPTGNAGKGRRAGVPNKITRALEESMLRAAERVGFYGAGKDGLDGYLFRFAAYEPKTFAGSLGKLMPTGSAAAAAESSPITLLDEQALLQKLRERGLPTRLFN